MENVRAVHVHVDALDLFGVDISCDMLTLVEQVFRAVEFRSAHTPESYRAEAVMQAMRSLYLDVMNAHASIFGREEVSSTKRTLPFFPASMSGHSTTSRAATSLSALWK